MSLQDPKQFGKVAVLFGGSGTGCTLSSARSASLTRTQVADAFAGRGQHGLEELEAGIERGEKTRLEQAFLEFVGRNAVLHDAGANAQTQWPQALLLRAQREGADRHRQAEVADGRAFSRRIDPADRAAVEAARRAFEFADPFHGAVLGRARDGAAGEHRAQQLGHADACAQPCLYGRGHLEHRGVGLDGKQRRHLDGTDARHAADVVAQQVDDHHVLGTVLGVDREPARHLAVALGRIGAGRGAFHGARGEHARVVAQEEFGRAREHVGDVALPRL